MATPELDALNDQFRRLLQSMTAVERRGVAERFNVTERTVQRWAKEPGTGQSRNFLPKRIRDVPIADMERKMIRRVNTAKITDRGLSQRVLSGDGTKVYVEKFRGPNAALEYMKSLRQNTGDKYLGSHYTSVDLQHRGGLWEVHVEYSAIYRVGFANERGAPGGSFLDDDLFGGALDDDLF